jgi:hypothetical protein
MKTASGRDQRQTFLVVQAQSFLHTATRQQNKKMFLGKTIKHDSEIEHRFRSAVPPRCRSMFVSYPFVPIKASNSILHSFAKNFHMDDRKKAKKRAETVSLGNLEF